MRKRQTLTKSMKSHHPPSLSSTQGESLFESYLAYINVTSKIALKYDIIVMSTYGFCKTYLSCE